MGFLPVTYARFNVFNAAARLVCGGPRHCHITPLLLELHWLPVKQRIAYKVILFTFKAIYGIAPVYIMDLVKLQSDFRYNLRSANSCLLAPYSHITKRTMGDRSFSVAAPSLWNTLPCELRAITDLAVFKRHLNTYLFRIAFY